MAETPEEAARRLRGILDRRFGDLCGHSHDANKRKRDGHGNSIGPGRGDAYLLRPIASALRAQYVAGLEAAANLAALVPTQQRLEVAEAIRELAEQAKAGR